MLKTDRERSKEMASNRDAKAKREKRTSRWIATDKSILCRGGLITGPCRCLYLYSYGRIRRRLPRRPSSTRRMEDYEYDWYRYDGGADDRELRGRDGRYGCE